MDFMLEMYAKDHPNEYTFNRNREEPDPMLFKIWADVFVGKTLNEFSLSPVAYFNKYYKNNKWKK